jgi:hypothetical protein
MTCLCGPSIVRTANCLVLVETRFDFNAHTGESYSDVILILLPWEHSRVCSVHVESEVPMEF